MDDFTFAKDDSGLNIKIIGSLNVAMLSSIQAKLRQELNSGVNEVVFDFDEATMIDSSGISLLIATHNTLKPRDGSVSLVNVSSDIFKLLSSMRLNQRMQISGK